VLIVLWVILKVYLLQLILKSSITCIAILCLRMIKITVVRYVSGGEIHLTILFKLHFNEIYVTFRLPEVLSVGVDMMHHSAVCSDAVDMLVAQSQAATTAAVDSNHSSSHGCVQPLVVNARPVILVSGHQVMHKAAAAAVGSVVVIQHSLPLSLDCSAKLQSSVTSQNDSQSTSHTRHKRKRRRKNKASYEMF